MKQGKDDATGKERAVVSQNKLLTKQLSSNWLICLCLCYWMMAAETYVEQKPLKKNVKLSHWIFFFLFVLNICLYF